MPNCYYLTTRLLQLQNAMTGRNLGLMSQQETSKDPFWLLEYGKTHIT